jgi:FkbM family methyltransferase
MKILYGAYETWIDVSDICLQKLKHGDVISVPFGDIVRASIFTDPCVGVHKKIVVITEHLNSDGTTASHNEFDSGYTIRINVATGVIDTINERSESVLMNDKITLLHSKLKLNHGTFMDELPEQKMVARYFTGTEKVLEIGGNIGRNSLIIASILNSKRDIGVDDTNRMLDFVSLESDENIANQLRENAILNNLSFHIESSALSKRRLMQRGWETVVNDTDTLFHGYKWVNTITLHQLRAKYDIEFDTLVLDCEGAFYYILMDMPEILDSIKLIVMENDYHIASEKRYVDDTLIKYGFYRDYVESGGWGPCQPIFFEVWKR